MQEALGMVGGPDTVGRKELHLTQPDDGWQAELVDTPWLLQRRLHQRGADPSALGVKGAIFFDFLPG